MSWKVVKSLVFLILLLSNSDSIAQYKSNIKTNVLSLLITVPQISFEVGMGKTTSITLSAFKGSYTFISESSVRGANLLFRKYFSKSDNLSGIYAEAGGVINGEYFRFENKWEDRIGGRLGLGWQFEWKRLVFDIGGALAAIQNRYQVFDINGQPTGEYMKELEPFMRLNTSIGFRF